MGEVVHDISVEEMKRVFQLQKKSQWKLKNTTAEERIELLNKLKEALEYYRDELNEGLWLDLGRPKTSDELDGVLEDLRYTVEHLAQWMEPEVHKHAMMETASYYVQYEPKGVTLLMGAWNAPIGLIFAPLIALLSAGNTVIVKPSSQAKHCSRAVAKVIKRAFTEDQVAVFEGPSTLANELQNLPFDHVFFTGSPPVGRQIMEKAAKHLSSVTLELGGRCPLIIDETAQMEAVIKSIGYAKVYNAGQICLSVNHVFVPESKVVELVEGLKAFFQGGFYEDGEFKAERVGKIINDKNFNRVVSYLQDAVNKGATIEWGGGYNREARTIEPTIVTNVPLNSALIENEIFGPILPIITYKDVEEVIDHVNAGGKPLGLYVFSHNDAFIQQVLNNTSSGGVTINGWAIHGSIRELPFGGANESGIGKYHGIYGFKELSNAKAVFKTF